MANPSVNYTFTNGTVADATQVNQNFTDLINGLTDGSKSLNVDAITAAGKATLNGAVDLGNATGDAITVNGAFAGTGGDASGTQRGLVTTAAQTFAGVKTLQDGAAIKGKTDGVAVAAGYVGEVIGWNSTGLNTTSAITNTPARIGNANSYISLNKGVFMLFVSGYGGVPSNVSFSSILNVYSGAATITALNTGYSSPMNETTVLNVFDMFYVVVVTQDNTVLEVKGAVSTGAYACRITGGNAIRIT